jgi:hypothetical protein
MGATIEYVRDTVFNYSTLAEAYDVAALDGLNKIWSSKQALPYAPSVREAFQLK